MRTVVAALLVLVTCQCVTALWLPWKKAKSDEDCAFSKQDVYVCVDRYGDTNNDRVLSRDEMVAIRGTFSIFSLFVIKLLGDVDGVISHCANEGEDEITRDSFFARTSCMGKCFHCEMAIKHYCEGAAKRAGENLFEVLGHRGRRTASNRLPEY